MTDNAYIYIYMYVEWHLEQMEAGVGMLHATSD